MMMINNIMNKNTLQGEIHYLLCLLLMLACQAEMFSFNYPLKRT
jgi:hypothetical protein